MRIKERPEFKSKSKPISFRPDTPVAEAVAVMAQRNIGSVLVTQESGELVGIVTERDLMRRLLAAHLNPQNTPLSAIMTTDIKVAHEDDRVVDWLQQMSNERFRHLPVVDSSGVVQKIMSQGDFVSYTWPSLLGMATAQLNSRIEKTDYRFYFITLALMIYTFSVMIFFHYF